MGADGQTSTRHWHALGNDCVTALATSHGYVVLHDFSRGPRYINYVPQAVGAGEAAEAGTPTHVHARVSHSYGGGFGWVKDRDSGLFASTLHADRRTRTPGTDATACGCGHPTGDSRVFGCGFFDTHWCCPASEVDGARPHSQVLPQPGGQPANLAIDRRVSVPFGGTDTWLVSRVTVRDTRPRRAGAGAGIGVGSGAGASQHRRKLRLWEYWDVSPRWLGWNQDEAGRTAAARTLRYDVTASSGGAGGLFAREHHTAASDTFLNRDSPWVPPREGPTVFLVPLGDTAKRITGFDTDPNAFFGAEGTRSEPRVVASGACTASTLAADAYPLPVPLAPTAKPAATPKSPATAKTAPPVCLPDAYMGPKEHPALVLQTDVELGPGEEVTLAFAFGFAYQHGNPRDDAATSTVPAWPTIEVPVSGGSPASEEAGSGDTWTVQLPADAMATEAATLEAWRRWLPSFDFPVPASPTAATRSLVSRGSLRRELAWHAYYTRVSSQYDAFFDRTTLTQGFWYQYVAGNHSNARDPLQAAIPLVYLQPALARNTLMSVLSQATPDGEVPYAMQGHGLRECIIWVPGDTDVFLLWLATEYVFVTRDFNLLSETLPFSIDHSDGLQARPRAKRVCGLVTLWLFWLLHWLAMTGLGFAAFVLRILSIVLAPVSPCRRMVEHGRVRSWVDAAHTSRTVSVFWLNLFLGFPASLMKATAVPPPQYERYTPLAAMSPRSADVWTHLRVAFQHLSQTVGVSPATGDLLRIRHGDWHDGIASELPLHSRSAFLSTGASVLTSAQAAYVLPRFAELATLHGDAATAAEAQALAALVHKGVRNAWTGRWFARGYAVGGAVVGTNRLFVEPQGWAVVAGVTDARMTRRLLTEIDTRLRRDSVLGTRNVDPIDETARFLGRGTNGGVWASLQHPVVWAAAAAAAQAEDAGESGAGAAGGDAGAVDAGGAEFAAALAWDEFSRSLLSTHARAYPDVWVGVWSGPDAYNSERDPQPGYTWDSPEMSLWCNAFPIMNVHAHCQPLLSALRLAGVEATSRGIRVRPCLSPGAPAVRGHVPWGVHSEHLSLSWHAREMRGSLRTCGTEIEVELRLPRDWATVGIDGGDDGDAGGDAVAYCSTDSVDAPWGASGVTRVAGAGGTRVVVSSSAESVTARLSQGGAAVVAHLKGPRDGIVWEWRVALADSAGDGTR